MTTTRTLRLIAISILSIGLLPITDLAPASGATASPYGVMVSGASNDPARVASAIDLGAHWVRLNYELGGPQSDPQHFLDAGVDVVLTITNNDPTNVITTYGTPAQYPHAGFPYVARDRYVAAVQKVVQALHPRVGHHVWVQCENEINDASLAPNSPDWRGTTNQYLTLLGACRTAVKRADARSRVVLAGMQSESLDAAINPANLHHGFAADRLSRLLNSPAYNVVDLHFYGCVETIPAKVAWIKARMRAGTSWISTEDAGPDPRCATTPITWRDARFESTQAAQVTRRLTTCAAQGGRICLWFSLRDLRGETDVFNHLGLIDSHSNPWRQRPAYDAFQRLTGAV